LDNSQSATHDSHFIKEIAILGPTASGKTALSLELAREYNAIILSLDSLSVYKEIDIASAKPTKEERGDILHIGIDEIYPDEHFNTILFFDLYKKAKEAARQKKQHLIIVGGTSFYLKSLMEGITPKPALSKETKKKIEQISKKEAFALMEKVDLEYSKKISPNDTYRIEKWLEIYLSTNTPPSKYFQKQTKNSIANDIRVYEIQINREELKDKISKRTDKMVKEGLIDEVLYLEKKYTREPKSMNSIGIKESLEYLDGYISLKELKEKITNKTAQLAKRQSTFNKSQFKDITKTSIEALKPLIKDYLKN
jgi:tRNA dimethylallyltransferase